MFAVEPYSARRHVTNACFRQKVQSVQRGYLAVRLRRPFKPARPTQNPVLVWKRQIRFR
jgi:hypothetical protein